MGTGLGIDTNGGREGGQMEGKEARKKMGCNAVTRLQPTPGIRLAEGTLLYTGYEISKGRGLNLGKEALYS